MKQQAPEWTWLDTRETVTFSQLSEACCLSAADLHDLVEYGALTPLLIEREAQVFSASWVSPLRTAGKLRRDFDLDLFSVAMLVGYLDRIETLERELRSVHAQHPIIADRPNV